MFRKVKKLSIRTEFRGSKIFTYQLRKKSATKEGKQVEKSLLYQLSLYDQTKYELLDSAFV